MEKQTPPVFPSYFPTLPAPPNLPALPLLDAKSGPFVLFPLPDQKKAAIEAEDESSGLECYCYECASSADDVMPMDVDADVADLDPVRVFFCCSHRPSSCRTRRSRRSASATSRSPSSSSSSSPRCRAR